MKTPLTESQVKELLAKARKGTDSSFGPSQWTTVFQAIGWKPEIVYGEKRAVVGFRVTMSDSRVLSFQKEHGYGALRFYDGKINGLAATSVGLGTMQQCLAKTTWLADVEKIIGPVPTKEDFQRPGAPHCPVCRRDILLDDDGKMVHHGYSRPGFGYIVGDCYGVKYQPWEVSPKGAEMYLVNALRPWLASAKTTLAELESGKITKVEAEEWQWEGHRQVKVYVTVTLESDAKRFTKILDGKIVLAKGEIAALEAETARFEADIKRWAAQPLPEYIGPVKMLHWEIDSRKWGGTTMACSAWAMRRKYAPMTKDKSTVTCKRCLKQIADAEAYQAKKAAQAAAGAP